MCSYYFFRKFAFWNKTVFNTQAIMNKRLTSGLAILAVLALTIGCSNKDPQRKGTEAGKAMCECYKLGSADEVEACLDKIEKENQEYLTDTSYLNAVESQLLQCITEGVTDIVKPIKEVQDSVKKAVADSDKAEQ